MRKVSYSYTNAVYDNFKIITKDINDQLIETNLKNKKVENAPENILRAGLTYMYKTLSVTGQVSYVSKTFSDANNTVTPNAAGTVGLIPAYTIGDISLS